MDVWIAGVVREQAKHMGGDDPLTYPATSGGGGGKGSSSKEIVKGSNSGVPDEDDGSEYEDNEGGDDRSRVKLYPNPTSVPAVMSTSECPPNTTNATGMVVVENPGTSIQDRDLVRQLAAAHYHSYGTALGVTIGVGCCLLLLNLLIFLAIYHQKTHK